MSEREEKRSERESKRESQRVMLKINLENAHGSVVKQTKGRMTASVVVTAKTGAAAEAMIQTDNVFC